jgi:hypothetical protein
VVNQTDPGVSIIFFVKKLLGDQERDEEFRLDADDQT